jgi:single-stranded DNA-binding protein
VNVVAMTGRVTAGATSRETRSGPVATFSLQVEGRRRARVDVECWGALAVQLDGRLCAGRYLGVEGALVGRVWTDQGGRRRERLRLRAERVTFLDLPADGQPASPGEPAAPSTPPREAGNQPRPAPVRELGQVGRGRPG